MNSALENRINLIDHGTIQERYVDVSKITLYRWVRNGRFPRPLLVGRKNQWVEREVQEWLEEQLAAR